LTTDQPDADQVAAAALAAAAGGAGPEILKQTLIQLVLYYQRFCDIARKAFTHNPAWMRVMCIFMIMLCIAVVDASMLV